MTVNCYETIIIFNGKYTEDKYNTLVEKYTNKLILDLKVHITKIDKIGKKKLAYEIKGIKEGWYVIFTYETKPDIMPELEKIMRTDSAVIKFLTIRRDPEEDELEEYAATPDDQLESEQESPGIKPEIDYFNLIYNIN